MIVVALAEQRTGEHRQLGLGREDRHQGRSGLSDHVGGHSGNPRIPPSTLMTSPVTKPAPSDARKATMPATSSGWPRRPTGMLAAANASRSSWVVSTLARSCSLTMAPGATQLTVTPLEPSSMARFFDHMWTAALAAWAGRSIPGSRAKLGYSLGPVMLTTRPQRASIITGSTCWVSRLTATKLRVWDASQMSSASNIGALNDVPA